MRLSLRYTTPDIHSRDRRHKCDGGMEELNVIKCKSKFYNKHLTVFQQVCLFSYERLLKFLQTFETLFVWNEHKNVSFTAKKPRWDPTIQQRDTDTKSALNAWIIRHLSWFILLLLQLNVSMFAWSINLVDNPGRRRLSESTHGSDARLRQT